jgi:DNA-directed RNA polymerase specialized sigma24 family protein
MTIEEAATALEISLATAKRDWTFARAWLAQRLGEDGAP